MRSGAQKRVYVRETRLLARQRRVLPPMWIAETDNNTVSSSIKNSFSNKKIRLNGLGPTKAKT